MAIKLMFSKQNQFFIISIENKVVRYWDKFEGKLWGDFLQYLPPDQNNVKKIEMSRNKIPKHFIELLKISKEELAEFENAKTDDELKDLVIRDAKKNNCKLVDLKIE